jgi:hypothetical protein
MRWTILLKLVVHVIRTQNPSIRTNVSVEFIAPQGPWVCATKIASKASRATVRGPTAEARLLRLAHGGCLGGEISEFLATEGGSRKAPATLGCFSEQDPCAASLGGVA